MHKDFILRILQSGMLPFLPEIRPSTRTTWEKTKKQKEDENYVEHRSNRRQSNLHETALLVFVNAHNTV